MTIVPPETTTLGNLIDGIAGEGELPRVLEAVA